MSKKTLALISATTMLLSSFPIYNIHSDFKGTLVETQKEQLSFKTDIQKYEEIYNGYLKLKKQEEIIRIQKENKERELAIQKEKQRIASVTYNPYDVTIPSNITTQELYEIFTHTKMRNKWNVAEACVEAEKTWGINAFVLASIVALEGDWNGSSRATGGSVNSTGYAVYDRGSKGQTFTSEMECIMKTACLLNDYIYEGGEYYVGGKSIELINSKYCLKNDKKTIDWSWTPQINSIIYNNLLSKYKR